MTTVLILGGAGFQGSHAAQELAKNKSITRIVLVDREMSRLETARESLSTETALEIVDVTQRSALVELFRKHKPQVVLNCAGPFRTLGAHSAAAAVEAGVHYVDICDDAQVVPKYMELDEAATQAGVSVIFGAGFTPGLTNIIGKYLAQDVASVQELHWTYLVNPTLQVAPHLMTHRVQMFAEDAYVVQNGESVQVPGGSNPIEIQWPGSGTFKAVVCTHPEPVLAQRYFPGIQHTSIRASYTSNQFLDLLTILGNANTGSSEIFETQGTQIKADKMIGDFLGSETFQSSLIWQDVLAAEEDYGSVDGVRVALSGTDKNGEQVRRVMEYVSTQRWLTTHGVAAAVAGLVATGQVEATGVHSPEVLEPDLIFPALRAVGIELEDYREMDAPEFTVATVDKSFI